MIVKRKSWVSLFSLFILVIFSLALMSCGSGDPGSPGSSGSGETGCMPLPVGVSPSNTVLTTQNLSETETVDVTISISDLPNQTDTCTAVTFTNYTVEFRPLTEGCPFIDSENYSGTWYAEPNSSTTLSLAFWNDHSKLQYRYQKGENNPRIYHYNLFFTMYGYNVFGKRLTVTFQFQVTTLN